MGIIPEEGDMVDKTTNPKMVKDLKLQTPFNEQQ